MAPRNDLWTCRNERDLSDGVENCTKCMENELYLNIESIILKYVGRYDVSRRVCHDSGELPQNSFMLATKFLNRRSEHTRDREIAREIAD